MDVLCACSPRRGRAFQLGVRVIYARMTGFRLPVDGMIVTCNVTNTIQSLLGVLSQAFQLVDRF